MQTSLRRVTDHDTFAKLPKATQAEVLARIEWIEQLKNAGRGNKGDIAAAAAVSLGVDKGTIHRWQKEYRSRGWQGLVDGRKLSSITGGLPHAFRSYVKQLHLQNQRSTTGREVHRMLVERWSQWRRTSDPQFAIPGYDTPPQPNRRTGIPEGWSIDNIYRLRPDAYAISLIRHGSKAAADFLPSILKTRMGLRFGEIVFFDDQDYDVKIVAPGMSKKTVRPQGFNALDYLSGCFLDYHIRLRWWDVEAEQYRTLTQQEFTWFVIAHLQRHGYRDDSGTTLVFEHGTATGYASQELGNFDDALAAVSGGKIKVNRSGLFNSPAFAGMLFRPQSSGNPNFKAPLESMFNLVRNRMAALPGATGLDRNHKPAEQYGQDLYTAQLLKVWERLDDRHRELMLFPVMNAQQFGTAAAAVYQAINSRTDHALEGWDACGFSVPQIRLSDDTPWMDQRTIARLPDKARELALAIADMPGHVRNVRLSPAQVAQACAHELTKLPDHSVPLLIPIQWAREAKVKQDRTVQIQDQLLGPEKFEYVARFETRDGAHVLNPGTQLLCYLNPFSPDRLVICRPDGSFLGTLTRTLRSGWLDTTSIVGQLEERARLKADLDASVRPHMQSLMQERAAMQRHNERLAHGQPVTEDEITAARSAAADKAVTTRRINTWQQDMPEDLPADLMQPDCETPASAIDDDQIADWLND